HRVLQPVAGLVRRTRGGDRQRRARGRSAGDDRRDHAARFRLPRSRHARVAADADRHRDDRSRLSAHDDLRRAGAVETGRVAAAGGGGRNLARAKRAAIGAGRARIVRQLVVESGVVGAAGAVGGMALVVALHRALPSLLPADFPRVADIAIDRHVLAFALATVVATSVGCGLLPAVHVARVDVAEVLAEDNAASAAGAWRSRAGRWRTVVMAGQIAVACMLLA